MAVLLLATSLLPLVTLASSAILDLKEGDSCQALGGGQGTCALLANCRNPGDFRREHPPICTFRGREPVICCPKLVSERLRVGMKASQYCQKNIEHCFSLKTTGAPQVNFNNARKTQEGKSVESDLLISETFKPPKKYVYNGRASAPRSHTHMIAEEAISCLPVQAVKLLQNPEKGDKFFGHQYSEDRSPLQGLGHSWRLIRTIKCNDRSRVRRAMVVLGVEDTEPKTRTFMVLIGYGRSDNKEWGCGGSLINTRFILSAAHCAKPQLLGDARWARLGDLDISTNTDDASIQDREIIDRIIHPDYKEPVVYNDIALFKMDRDVSYTPWVAPVCLHTERNIPYSNAIVTGWGRVEFAGETSNKLLEAELNLFNDTECQELLPYKDTKTPRGIDSNLMFCAGKRDGSKDACSGDSGGPLVISIPNQCLKTQVGITSFGSQCGLPDSPGVYTRVSRYISWIEEIAFFNETG